MISYIIITVSSIKVSATVLRAVMNYDEVMIQLPRGGPRESEHRSQFTGPEKLVEV
jgi:hypothetical protein